MWSGIGAAAVSGTALAGGASASTLFSAGTVGTGVYLGIKATARFGDDAARWGYRAGKYAVHAGRDIGISGKLFQSPHSPAGPTVPGNPQPHLL